MGRTAHLLNVEPCPVAAGKIRLAGAPSAPYNLHAQHEPNRVATRRPQRSRARVGERCCPVSAPWPSGLPRARSCGRAPGGGPRPGSISPERERELESLRRIAAELARTSDVEGVARALLDEISSLFSVGFVALTFVSDDAREGAGFLARKRRQGRRLVAVRARRPGARVVRDRERRARRGELHRLRRRRRRRR